MHYAKNSTTMKSEVTATVRNILYIVIASLTILAMMFTAYNKWLTRGIRVEALEQKFERVVPAVDTLKIDVRLLKSDVGEIKTAVNEIAETMNGGR